MVIQLFLFLYTARNMSLKIIMEINYIWFLDYQEELEQNLNDANNDSKSPCSIHNEAEIIKTT